jgi:isopentenyl-diphosphate delta-isomerase
MSGESSLSARKADHIRINLDEDVRSAVRTGLDAYRFVHQALPEVDLDAVDTSQVLFGKRVRYPILISSMTGGTERAAEINRVLAEAAQACEVAMGVGSQRAAIEHPELAESFRVRKTAPDILLFANLGAVQLNYRYGVDECRRAMEMIDADALILHLNPLQEALQPEGDTRFAALTEKIEMVCRTLGKPVIAKEVGWGISRQAAQRLKDAGVAAIDVAGAGGTSWSQVEMYRIAEPWRARVAGAFRNWGVPTAESILNVRAVAPELPVFASGGLKDGIDAAKSIALGASLAGMAGLLLKAAVRSLDETVDTLNEIARTIEIVLFATGVTNLTDFQTQPVLEKVDPSR